MKSVLQRFKFLVLFILALFIIIPTLVFGEDWYSGFPLASGQKKILDLTPIGAGKVCVTNNSGSAYFLPTRTYNPEWLSLLSAAPRKGLTFPACCGDGVCNGSENCSNCGDCGSCVTCSSFNYSAWSGCCNGTQTRSVLSSGPAYCTGGSPVTSQSCSSYQSGCQSGTCRNGTIYLNSGYCTGSSISQNNVCMGSGTPNSSCIYGGSYSSQYYVPSSGCTYSVSCSATAGCPGGSSCRSASVYLSNSSCGGGVSNSLSSVCIANTDPNGTCLSYNSITSIIYSPGSGCSY